MSEPAHGKGYYELVAENTRLRERVAELEASHDLRDKMRSLPDAEVRELRERVAELEEELTEHMAVLKTNDYWQAENKLLEQHLADARVRSESLERQVGEWWKRAEAAERKLNER